MSFSADNRARVKLVKILLLALSMAFLGCQPHRSKNIPPDYVRESQSSGRKEPGLTSYAASDMPATPPVDLISADPGTHTLLVAAFGHVYASYDLGSSWHRIGEDLPGFVSFQSVDILDASVRVFDQNGHLYLSKPTGWIGDRFAQLWDLKVNGVVNIPVESANSYDDLARCFGGGNLTSQTMERLFEHSDMSAHGRVSNIFVHGGLAYLESSEGLFECGLGRFIKVAPEIHDVQIERWAVSSTHFFAYAGGRVFLKAFAEPSWTRVNLGLNDRTVTALTPIQDELLISTTGGLYRLEQTKTGWITTLIGLPNLEVDGAASLDGVIFAATNRGVYRLKDGWEFASAGIRGEVSDSVLTDKGVLLVDDLFALYGSTDLGTTWKGPGYTGSWEGSSGGESWRDSRSRGALAFDSTLYAQGGDASSGIVESKDGGKRWTEVQHRIRNGYGVTIISDAEFMVSPDGSGKLSLM